MDELDLFRTFRRGVAPPDDDALRRARGQLANALEPASARAQLPPRRNGRRRLAVLAAAVLMVVVVTASALGTARGILRAGPVHVYTGFFQCQGKRGSFEVHLRFPSTGTRNWKIASGTGAYSGMTGGGRIPQVGGSEYAWHARLEGFVSPGAARQQRIAITITGRPSGVFVLTPLHKGALRRDWGTQSSFWTG